LRAKRDLGRRRAHEQRAPARAEGSPPIDPAAREALAAVHEEIERLPEKYRLPVVLCCLEDKTKAAAARELGWKEGTVSSRLAQARERLRGRLARRGVVPAVALAGAGAAAVPAELVAATARAAVLIAAGEAAAAEI